MNNDELHETCVKFENIIMNNDELHEIAKV